MLYKIQIATQILTINFSHITLLRSLVIHLSLTFSERLPLKCIFVYKGCSPWPERPKVTDLFQPKAALCSIFVSHMRVVCVISKLTGGLICLWSQWSFPGLKCKTLYLHFIPVSVGNILNICLTLDWSQWKPALFHFNLNLVDTLYLVEKCKRFIQAHSWPSSSLNPQDLAQALKHTRKTFICL